MFGTNMKHERDSSSTDIEEVERWPQGRKCFESVDCDLHDREVLRPIQ